MNSPFVKTKTILKKQAEYSMKPKNTRAHFRIDPDRNAVIQSFRRCSLQHVLPGRAVVCPSPMHVGASLPVVDNNPKVVGALSVVGEKFSKMLA